MATTTYSWTNFADPFFVNTVTAGIQASAAVTSFTNGNYFAVWDLPSNVEGRILTPGGTGVTGEFQANSTAANSQFDAAIATLVNGNAAVVFTDTSVDAGGDIRARLFSPTGTAVNVDFGVDTAAADDTDADVAALADGGFVVSYTREVGAGDFDIRSAIFNADGSARGSVVLVDSSTALNTNSSSVAGLTGGNFVVAWEQQPTAGGDTEVFYRIYNSSGTAVTSATLIDTTGSINLDIQVAALQDGGFAVAYVDNGWALSGTEITLRIYNADGSLRADNLLPNTNTAGDQNKPSLTVLGNGFIVVSWNDGNTTTYQAYTPGGARVGNNVGAFNESVETEIASLGGGLVAGVRASTVTDASGDQSIRSSVIELTRSIVGDGTSETLTGDALRDTLTGNAGNDTLNAAAGNDTLNGGQGIDTAIFAGSRSAYTFSSSGGTRTITGPDGTDTFASIERMQFADAMIRVGHAGPDFNGDGKSDLLLYKAATGSVQPVLMNGVNWTEALEHVWTGWKVASAGGDFNGDGKSDLVIHNATTGSVQPIVMNGVNWTAAQEYLWSGWKVVSGNGDYNGDGKSDLVIHKASTGSVQVVLMNGVNWTSALEHLWSGWKVVGATGDYNGDGKSDLVLHKASTGSVQIVLMNGVTWTQALEYQWAGWKVVSADGDYNGDGKADLVLHKESTGSVQIVLMDGVNWTQALEYQWAGWKVVSGDGDYNADGKSDLVLHKESTGSVQVVLMDGVNWTQALEYQWAGWKVVAGEEDFNDDGKSDLVLHKESIGHVQVVLMDGVNWTQALEYQWQGWQVVNNAEEQNTFDTTRTGTAGNDTLTGTSGDDLLLGLAGNDILTGGGGADDFAYGSIGEGLDTIVDFTRGVDGDALDISDLLVGNFTPGWQNPANFVQLVESGGNTTVSVNLDGAGNDFVPLATLQGVTGAVLNDMLSQGNLILS